MSINKDLTDIPVKRVTATSRLEIFLKKNGAIERVLAHRWLYTRQAGVDVVPPVHIGTIEVPVASIGTGIVNRITDLDAMVDALDTAPIIVPPQI